MRISSELHAQLLALAADSPDVEVCGLLFGDDREIKAFEPACNVAPSAADSFEIDPATLIAAHRTMRGGGPGLIGYYHSHPNGMAEPSPRDLMVMAEVGGSWLIIAAEDATCWRMDGAELSEVPLELTSIPRC